MPLCRLQYFFELDPAQAAMIDRASPEPTRTTKDRVVHRDMTLLVERLPAKVISGAKDHHAGGIDSAGEMSRTSIIAYKKIQSAHERGQPAKRGFASQIDRLPFHMLNDVLHS